MSESSSIPPAPVSRTPPRLRLRTHPSPHPFLRRNLADGSLHDLRPVDLVTLLVPGGDVFGDAFFNARSDIAFRRITRGDERLDAAFLARAVDRAARLRERLPAALRDSTALRLVHGEGDELSGLVVDRYGDVLSVEFHSAGWTLLVEPLLAALHARFGTTHHRVTLSERVADFEGVRPLVLQSDGCPASVTVREHGLRFRVDFAGGHKTGFFCDQRLNRRLLAEQVEGGDVLDLCTYNGGFAVAAKALGGASSVTAVDLDETALATARTNANLNQARISFVHADAFDWCRQIGAGERRFDTVVLDPPKFLPSEAERETGRGRYHDLNRLALRLLRPGALFVTCSCSGLLARDELVELVRSAARKEGRSARLLGTTGAGPDHPVHLEVPESEYLKVLWMRVE